MSPNPFDRLAETGEQAFAACRSRNDNPHPHGSADRERWFAAWDDAALVAARLMKSGGAAALYNACNGAAHLLRDMRNSPRALTARSTRYRDTEVALSLALSKAMDAQNPALKEAADAAR